MGCEVGMIVRDLGGLEGLLELMVVVAAVIMAETLLSSLRRGNKFLTGDLHYATEAAHPPSLCLQNLFLLVDFLDMGLFILSDDGSFFRFSSFLSSISKHHHFHHRFSSSTFQIPFSPSR